MEFIVTDRRTIEKGIIVRSAYVVISIRDPGKHKARLRKTSGLRDALFLAFHDAESADGLVLPPSIQLMTVSDAERIWRFVQEHLGNVGTIVCHCEQGMSRSPAVAVALAEALGENTEAILACAQPNWNVYNLLRATIARLQREE